MSNTRVTVALCKMAIQQQVVPSGSAASVFQQPVYYIMNKLFCK